MDREEDWVCPQSGFWLLWGYFNSRFCVNCRSLRVIDHHYNGTHYYIDVISQLQGAAKEKKKHNNNINWVTMCFPASNVHCWIHSLPADLLLIRSAGRSMNSAEIRLFPLIYFQKSLLLFLQRKSFRESAHAYSIFFFMLPMNINKSVFTNL